MERLTLLTRVGCANTELFRSYLEEALLLPGTPSDYEVVDIRKLPEHDTRRGYPTPTLLYDGQDIFGMNVPEPPFDDPG
jgi:hypothetical protein